jgi:hypothetical protein
MAVDHVKSTPITNLDASPVVQPTAGEGGPAPLKSMSTGYVHGRCLVLDRRDLPVRPRAVELQGQEVIFESEAQAAGKFDIGVYYATDGEGGKPTALLAANAICQASSQRRIALTSP